MNSNQTLSENELSYIIIGHAIDIHKTLGPGLLESAYKECLCYRLIKNGLQVAREKPLPFIFEEVKLDCGYRMDIVVEDKIIIELKCVECLNDIHVAQTLTYLRLYEKKLALLINFNVLTLKDGIRRIINGKLS